MAQWTRAQIPNLQGLNAVVTGTGGLGLEDAIALAAAGAHVIIAGRNPSKGQAAVEQVQQHTPGAKVSFEQVDLADLASIRDFATRLGTRLHSLDLLINNAAVMTPPQRQRTADGFELQFGTNYLGHFALTAQLLPLLRKSKHPRVVTLSSVAARDGSIDFDNLQAEREYKPMVAYGQSKLACLMFALELQRKSEAANWGISSLAAHPGISRTDLIVNGTGQRSFVSQLRKYLWFLFQPAEQGALPTLYAATSPEAQAGKYYGPDKLNEVRGYPALAKIPVQALNTAVSAKLWEVSKALTQVSFSE